MRNAIAGSMISLVVTMALAVVPTQAFGASKATTNDQAPPQAINGEQQTSAAQANSSEENFQKAHESFMKKDTQAAAVEILKGAAFLKVEASHASGQAKQALNASVQELERLAQAVEQGTVTSGQDLRRAFARADRALAEEHFQEAVESWSKKEVHKTGQDLTAAADDVRQAFSWTGQKLNSTTEAAINDAHGVVTKLIEGVAWTREEVGKDLDTMSKEIGKLRQQV
ncbi:MAG TPA: hypothetical protein VLX11_09820 [Candidatus Acidoferrales bacterium]|nr:hypothetical protein [Candidatus Acidoferrales bacterium]